MNSRGTYEKHDSRQTGISCPNDSLGKKPVVSEIFGDISSEYHRFFHYDYKLIRAITGLGHDGMIRFFPSLNATLECFSIVKAFCFVFGCLTGSASLRRSRTKEYNFLIF